MTNNISDSDVPHDVIVQYALAPYFGAFDKAADPAGAVMAELAKFGLVIISADDSGNRP